MASVTAALRDRLKAAGAVQALVSGRVYRVERPQGDALPAITFTQITPGRRYTYSGASEGSDRLVQFDCWGRSYGEAEAVGDALITVLELPATVGGIKFHRGVVTSAPDMPPERDGAGNTVFRRLIEMRIWSNPA